MSDWLREKWVRLMEWARWTFGMRLRLRVLRWRLWLFDRDTPGAWELIEELDLFDVTARRFTPEAVDRWHRDTPPEEKERWGVVVDGLNQCGGGRGCKPAAGITKIGGDGR